MFIDSRLWRHVARELSTLLHVSYFQSFICLLVLILCRRGRGAFEDEITEPTAAMASCRISFLYTSFHVQGCPPRAPAASGRLRNSFFPAWLAIYERRAVFCLSAKLLGKDYRFASPDATVGFWQPTCSFSAAICEVGSLYPKSCGLGSPTEVSSFCRRNLLLWPKLLFHPLGATGCAMKQNRR